jgi:serine/threonine-protein kinase HipA
MRKALVFRNGEITGTLIQNSPENYEFIYDDAWLINDKCPAISLTLPKSQKVFQSDYLFPFFFNLLSEGVNKELQCRQLKIDKNDYFGLLLATASKDTIGAITISPVEFDE